MKHHMLNKNKSRSALQEKINEVIFGTDTPAGKLFDEILIIVILLSVLAMMLDSVNTWSSQFGEVLTFVEWTFTFIFTLEYLARIYSSPKPWAYIRSFFGICDLVSIMPSFLGLIFPNASYLLMVRLFRVMRIFRIFKLVRYINEANVLVNAILQSRRKIFVFFLVVLIIATIFGSIMYIVEGPGNGFSSIPKSIYWTIVTITTVGYGDITPQTPIGQIVASLAMLTGYSIIAVPTGILTAELAQEMIRERNAIQCPSCSRHGHDKDAKHCKHCGAKINITDTEII